MAQKRTSKDLMERIKNNYASWGVVVDNTYDEVSASLAPEKLTDFMMALRDDLAFFQLTDICSVDYLGRDPRFDVVYHVLSHRHNQRLRVKVAVKESQSVPSLVTVFKAANWYEREVWDLMGIPFEGHPDMRRLLTDYGFEGHPLRKDFPLTGTCEVRYDPLEERVVYDAVHLPQAYRDFDFESPWQGMEAPLLPGDEKATQDAS